MGSGYSRVDDRSSSIGKIIKSIKDMKHKRLVKALESKFGKLKTCFEFLEALRGLLRAVTKTKSQEYHALKAIHISS